MKHERKADKIPSLPQKQETSVLKFLITKMLYGMINTFIIPVLPLLC